MKGEVMIEQGRFRVKECAGGYKLEIRAANGDYHLIDWKQNTQEFAELLKEIRQDAREITYPSQKTG